MCNIKHSAVDRFLATVLAPLEVDFPRKCAIIADLPNFVPSPHSMLWNKSMRNLQPPLCKCHGIVGGGNASITSQGGVLKLRWYAQHGVGGCEGRRVGGAGMRLQSGFVGFVASWRLLQMDCSYKWTALTNGLLLQMNYITRSFMEGNDNNSQVSNS